MKQRLVWYVLYFTRYQVQPFFGDVQPKFCFVWPRWCLRRTFVLSREKNYLQPFPGSRQVLKKWDSKLYLYACASWRKKGYADQQISIRGEGAKGWRSGESARLPPMWRGSNQRHTWVELVVGSLLYSERFFCGYSGFPLSSKPTFPNSNSTRNEEPLCGCATSRSLFIYLFRGEEQGCAIVAPGYPLGRLLHCEIIFGLVHTYLDIFENREYFLLWKKSCPHIQKR